MCPAGSLEISIVHIWSRSLRREIDGLTLAFFHSRIDESVDSSDEQTLESVQLALGVLVLWVSASWCNFVQTVPFNSEDISKPWCRRR